MAVKMIRTEKKGFTLIEVLISIFIFSILVSTLYASLRAIFSGVKPIQEGMAVYEMVKNCMDRMVTDLGMIHVTVDPAYKKPGINDTPSPYRVVGDISAAGNGDASRLRFTSTHHASFEDPPRDGIAEIVYYVTQKEDFPPVLKRADGLYPYKRFEKNVFEEKDGDPVLCTDVKSLTFTYYNSEGEEHDSWNSESDEFKYATPRAVKIKLEIGDESSSLFFETMVYLPVYRKEEK